MKTMKTRVPALILCLTMILGCAGLVQADDAEEQTEAAAPVPAAETGLPSDTVSDNESVYVLTDASGVVQKTIVSDRITEADGEQSASQTQEQKDLPVDVRFTYRLDGKEIAPEELAGKSGEVEIRIDYTNHAWAEKEINGKTERLCVPFLTLSALLLDNDHFSNVRVENGKSVNDGTRTVVVGYALPGMGESLALPEDLDLTIPDHVTVTANATDFTLGSVYTLAANDLFKDYDESDPDGLEKLVNSMTELTDAMDQLLDGAQALNDGLDTLLAKSGELTSGVSALRDGADQAADGAGKLADGARSLSAGAREVQNGAGKLADGAGSLLGGADQLANGAAQLSAGLTQLSENSAAINDGAKTVFQSLLSAAQTQLTANGLSVSCLTISNYQTELSKVIASLDHDAVYAQALAQVTAGVEAKRPEIEALVTASVREQVTQTVTAKVQQTVSEQVAAAVEAAVRGKVVSAATGLSAEEYEAAIANGAIGEDVQTAVEAQITAQLSSSEVQAQIETATAEKMSSDEVQDLISRNTEAQMKTEDIQAAITANTEAQVRKAVADTMAGDEVQSKLDAASEGAKSVIALKTSLDQYNAFYLGVQSYTAGVDAAANGAKTLSSGTAELKTGAASLANGGAALSAGTKTLSDGAASLSDGAAALSNGANRLAAGVRTLQDKLPALIDGVTKLRDGSEELHSGMEQFNEEGIAKLSEFVTVDAEGVAERLRAIASLGKEYHSSYTGLPGSVDSEVRFIFRTDGIGE